MGMAFFLTHIKLPETNITKTGLALVFSTSSSVEWNQTLFSFSSYATKQTRLVKQNYK